MSSALEQATAALMATGTDGATQPSARGAETIIADTHRSHVRRSDATLSSISSPSVSHSLRCHSPSASPLCPLPLTAGFRHLLSPSLSLLTSPSAMHRHFEREPSHCPVCNCDDCYDEQAPVARGQGAATAAQQSFSATPSLPTSSSPPPSPSPPPPSSPPPCPAPPAAAPALSSASVPRYLLYAGVSAAFAAVLLLSRRHHRVHLYHRGYPAAAGAGAASSAYEMGFRRGSEVTANLYRSMADEATAAVRRDLMANAFGRGRWRGC